MKTTVKMTMALAAAAVSLVSSASFAGSLSMEWKGRNSKVICGGLVDGKELDMKVSIPNERMKAETGRMLIFIDLQKEGLVRWVMSDSMTDEEYDKREAIMAKLSSEEQALLKSISVGRQTDLYSGMTADGYVTIMQSMGKRSFSLACQEIKN